MPKPRTPDEFSRQVQQDFLWRFKEITDIKSSIGKASSFLSSNTAIRALVVLTYAHWEGHIKYCAERFADYLSMRRMRFRELSDHFYEVRFAREIQNSGRLSLEDTCALVKKVRSSTDDRFSHFPRDIIDTKSNLNSDVLKNICMICGIRFELFQPHADFIDRILLARRNAIAHGENSLVFAVDPDDLSERTITIMRTFRDECEASITLGHYKSALDTELFEEGAV